MVNQEHLLDADDRTLNKAMAYSYTKTELNGHHKYTQTVTNPNKMAHVYTSRQNQFRHTLKEHSPQITAPYRFRKQQTNHHLSLTCKLYTVNHHSGKHQTQ